MEKEKIRGWIFVNDHCEALIKILEKGKIGEFLCGSNINYKNIEITKLLINIAKKIKLRSKLK